MKTKLIKFGFPIIVTLSLLYCFILAATLITVVISAVIAEVLFFWWIGHLYYHATKY